MPLPNLNRRCKAQARSTGNRCLNPAAFGCKTCRYHGARRRDTVKVRKAHPQYKHGERMQEAIVVYRRAMLQLQVIETLGYSVGVLRGPRTIGRKQAGRKKKRTSRAVKELSRSESQQGADLYSCFEQELMQAIDEN